MVAPLIASVYLFLAALVSAQGPQGPQAPPEAPPGQALTDKRYAYDQIPYKVGTSDGPRGTQQGFNQCNSTTQTQDSLCQTALINNITDFCLWSSPTPNGQIGDIEGESVAWCTKATHGTRLIPSEALKGVQFMRTPSYVQVSGIIDQTLIGLTANDTGGELDPHGADQRGNPLGGLVYSNAYSQNGSLPTQVIEWHNFMGANAFCFKACDPSADNDAQMCQHIFDRTGCAFNAPSDSYKRENVFESCQGDDQDPPGVYTENGVVMTYTQPAEGVEIGTLPFAPRVPPSSSCTAYTSSAIYTDAASLAPASVSHSVAASLGLSLSGASDHEVVATASPDESGDSGSDSSGDDSDGAASIVAPTFIVSALAGCALFSLLL